MVGLKKTLIRPLVPGLSSTQSCKDGEEMGGVGGKENREEGERKKPSHTRKRHECAYYCFSGACNGVYSLLDMHFERTCSSSREHSSGRLKSLNAN